jgi:hypothetical protein
MPPPDPDAPEELCPRLKVDLLEDDDELVDAVARRVANFEGELGPSVALEAAIEVVREQLDGDGRDALALALALLDERRDAVALAIARASLQESVAAIRDADGVLRDEEQRSWWIDRVLRGDREVRRLGDRLRRREEQLRRLVDDDAFRAYLRLEATSSERSAQTHDAIIAAIVTGRPAPARRRG